MLFTVLHHLNTTLPSTSMIIGSSVSSALALENHLYKKLSTWLVLYVGNTDGSRADGGSFAAFFDGCRILPVLPSKNVGSLPGVDRVARLLLSCSSDITE